MLSFKCVSKYILTQNLLQSTNNYSSYQLQNAANIIHYTLHNVDLGLVRTALRDLFRTFFFFVVTAVKYTVNTFAPFFIRENQIHFGVVFNNSVTYARKTCIRSRCVCVAVRVPLKTIQNSGTQTTLLLGKVTTDYSMRCCVFLWSIAQAKWCYFGGEKFCFAIRFQDKRKHCFIAKFKQKLLCFNSIDSVGCVCSTDVCC